MEVRWIIKPDIFCSIPLRGFIVDSVFILHRLIYEYRELFGILVKGNLSPTSGFAVLKPVKPIRQTGTMHFISYLFFFKKTFFNIFHSGGISHFFQMNFTMRLQGPELSPRLEE